LCTTFSWQHFDVNVWYLLKKKKKDSLRPICIWHFNADTVWI
jgi:hypothetical protein